MKIGDLVTRARILLDDRQSPYLWETDELLLYVNDGLEMMAVECRIIEDDITADDLEDTPNELCEITMVVDQASYTVSPKVIEIIGAKVLESGSTVRTKIEMWEKKDLDRTYPGWEATTSKPRMFYVTRDMDIVLYPYPDTAGTLYLHVIRLPLTIYDANELDVELPIRGVYHTKLTDYLLYRAYQKKDAETYNPDKADRHRQLFEHSLEEIKLQQIRFQNSETVVQPEDVYL